VLGALPQAVKLYAAQGLLWTNVWSTLFLMSFIVVELIVLVAGKDWRAVMQLHHNGVRSAWYAVWLRFASLGASSGVALYLLICLALEVEERFMGLVVLACLDAATLTFRLYHHTPLYSAAHFCIHISAIPYLMSSSINASDAGDIIFAGSIMLMYFFTFALTFLSAKKKTTRLDDALFVRLFFRISCVTLHLIVAIGYYAFLYDPSTTMKPGWTDYHG